MINVTYGITVHNELNELIKLLNFLQPRLGEDDEILIQYDESSVTDEVLNYINVLDGLHENHRVIGFPLEGDFASFKNNLKNHSKGIYIFQIDADEIPNEFLVENIHELLEANKEVDLFFIPRINTVEGITDEHIKRWGWKVNEKGWINFPDVQTRLYRRTSEIEWEGKVHERIKGYNTMTVFPLEERFCLYHHKEIERQERQNDFYETL
jgi:hypothetical protein